MLHSKQYYADSYKIELFAYFLGRTTTHCFQMQKGFSPG